MTKIINQFSSIEQISDRYLKKNSQDGIKIVKEASFEEVFKQTQSVSATEELKFSKHASMRMENRNIQLSTDQRARLENGTAKAQEKGIRESLVLVDSMAFIVNVPNKTVVTAMDQRENSDNIYTNIDGTVIM